MSHEQETNFGWAKLAATGMAATIALTACTAGQETAPRPSTSVVEQVPTPDDTVKPYVPPACPAPSATDISMATKLLSQKANTLFTSYEDNGSADNFESKRQALDHREAAYYGLTIYSSLPTANKLDAELDGKSGEPSSAEILKIDQSFMAKLGVDVELGTPSDPNYLPGSRPPTAAEFNSLASKYTLLDLLEAYDGVPKEYIELSGLKHIYLIDGTKDNDEGYAITSGKHDTYYMDLTDDTYGASTDTFAHENYHLLDAAECGSAASAMDDPSFTRFNEGKDLYTTNPDDTRFISYTGKYLMDAAKRATREENDLVSGKHAAYCKEVAADNKEAAEVMSYSDYHTDVVEDKAEIGKNLTYPFGYDALADKHLPVLYQKFRLLFARLYQHAPRVAEYLAAISNRPDTAIDPAAPKC